jgi:hypothetical protein
MLTLLRMEQYGQVLISLEDWVAHLRRAVDGYIDRFVQTYRSIRSGISNKTINYISTLFSESLFNLMCK